MRDHRSVSVVLLLIVLVGLRPLPAEAQSCLAPAGSTTGWWMGDGTAIDNWGSRSATLHNGAGYAGGQVSSAFALDGVDDFVSVADDPALDLGTGPFGFNFWVRLDDPSTNQVLIEKYVASASPSGWSLSWRADIGRWRFEWAGGSFQSGSTTLTPGVWYHIAVVRNGSQCGLWVNDTMVAGTASFSGNLDTSASLKLGHRGSPADTPGSTDNSGQWLDGGIDEVIYTVGAVQTGGMGLLISDIYNAGSLGVCAPTSVCADSRLDLGELCDDGNLVDEDGCQHDCTWSCGNGVIAGSETCDDGNRTSGDGCDISCQPTGCGSGVVTGGEVCDDGNVADGDGCDGNCTPTGCRNGIVTAGEICDDGNLESGDGCDFNCTPTGCGNEVVTAGEACDDGNADDTDDCANDCTRNCGNGVPNGTEQCDDGNLDDDPCDGNCMWTVCGNGYTQASELCDDGNLDEGDGCDSNCTPTGCGNGILTSGELCEDGNLTDGDGCESDCTLSCGNGVVTGSEQCDDGNVLGGDGCSASCIIEYCGDGQVHGAETCDDGNPVDGDGCDSNCQPTGCPNGVVSAGEICDDGNGGNGDGCDSNCTPTGCGNGIRTSGEECDDGNVTDKDGCEGTCALSSGILDPSFDLDGIVQGGDMFEYRPLRVGLQSDGSVVAAYTDGLILPRQFTLARYASDGSLDASFGAGGVVHTAIGVADAVVSAVAVQSDDRIVVAGVSNDGAGARVAVVRYLPDGDLDPSFAGGGVLVVNAGPVGVDVRDVALGAGNSILVAGGDDIGRLLLVRILSGGTVDTVFGDAGLVVDGRVYMGTSSASVAVQPDGRIVAVAGGYESYGGDPEDIVVLRYLDDGSADADFGVDGMSVVNCRSEDPVALALQNDGKIVLAAQYQIPNPSGGARQAFGTFRLNDNGSLDASYGSDGISVIDAGAGFEQSINGVAIDPATGVITGVGRIWGFGAPEEVTITRFRSDGTPDPGLFGRGWVKMALGYESVAATDLLLQPDGKAVLALETAGPGPDRRIALARLRVGTCGDGWAQTMDGEQCDDGNETDGDGCEDDCTRTPVVEAVGAGGTVSTDALSEGATPSAPVQTDVTSPNAGTVTIATPPVVQEPEGLTVVGVQLQIEAPPASWEAPLAITLVVDASAIPPGVAPDRIEVTRNGAVVEDCAGASGVASPDPCVESRDVLGDGDAQITVLTSLASLWSMVVRGLVPGEQECIEGIGKDIALVAKAQGKENAACLRGASKGQVADVEACQLADVKGKVESKMQKTTETAAELCAPAPPFGFMDAGTATTGARGAVADLVAAALGTDADAAVATSKYGAACQSAVVKEMQKIFDAETKAYLACVKDPVAAGAADAVIRAAQLAGCLGIVAEDAGGKLAKAVAKLAKAIESKCYGNAAELLPGPCGGASAVAACLADRVDCAVCKAFDAAHALGADCDQFDNGLSDVSCE